MLALLGARFLRALEAGLIERAINRHALTVCISVALAALGVERCYYIAARLLQPQGLNLWALHPAPEVLSAVVATGLYVANVPFILARATSAAGVGRAITLDLSIVVILFGSTVWAFY